MYQPPNSFDEYMQAKKEKLETHFEENRDKPVSFLFKDLCFFINGYTEPSYQQLKHLISQHSGHFYHYYERDKVTHVLTSDIPENKFKFFSSKSILVRPQWITDCIDQKSLRETQSYQITPSRSNSFVHKFFDSSRLHHLSKWRNELQEYSAQLMEQKKVSKNNFSLILHADIDCFFASASCAYGKEPHLINIVPIGVAHTTNADSAATSTSDIASCNYVARSFGIKNGMSVRQAKELCPELKLFPYNFDLYNEISRSLYKILSEYASDLEAVSCDEAYLDISGYLDHYPDDKEALEQQIAGIKERIQDELKVNVSIGVSYNKLLSRLCTKLAKPNGIFIHIDSFATKLFITQFKIQDIPGIGNSICTKLSHMVIILSNFRELSQLNNCKIHPFKD